MFLREDKFDERFRVLNDVIKEHLHEVISADELLHLVNANISNQFHKLANTNELSNVLRQLVKYKKFTNNSNGTEYLFIKSKEKRLRWL